MIKLKDILLATLGAVLAVSAVFIFIRRADVAAGIFFGAVIGMVNFLFLQVSVKALVAPAGAAAGKNYLVKRLAAYFGRFLAKLLLLAVLLFVLVKLLAVNWLGILLGLLLATAVYMVQVMRKRK